MNRSRRAFTIETACLAFAVLSLWAGCSNSGGGGTDSNTNWYAHCETDGECEGGLDCVCGACTLRCDALGDCPAPLVCREGGARRCGGETVRTCRTACVVKRDCPQALECTDGFCIEPASSDAGSDAPSGRPDAAGGSGGTGAGGSGPEPDAAAGGSDAKIADAAPDAPHDAPGSLPDAPGLVDTRVPASLDCGDYCDAYEATCSEIHPAYSSTEVCRSVCAMLPPGAEPGDAALGDNTVGCRRTRVDLATSTSDRDYCAGAAANGDGVCGTSCEAYCGLLAGFCPELAPGAGCERRCAALPGADFATGELSPDGNSLACRLSHVTEAGVDGSRCAAAGFVPSPPCDTVSVIESFCDQYCRVVFAACNGSDAVYEATSGCMAVCEPLVPNRDVPPEMACRLAAAYDALAGDASRCPAAGPLGDGVCGAGACDFYCAFASDTCPKDFTDTFGNTEACLAQCASLPDAAPGSGYSVALPDGPTLACRMKHLEREAALLRRECSSVVGGAPCD